MFLWIDDNPGILFIDGDIVPTQFNCVYRKEVKITTQQGFEVTLWR